MPSSFSHSTVFKSLLLVSFRLLPTSRKSAIRGLSVSEPELSISDTKPKSTTCSFQWSVLLSTIALDQSAGEKSLSYCKKVIANNCFITLAKSSCNRTVISLPSAGSAVFAGSAGSAVPRSAVPRISLTQG